MHSLDDTAVIEEKADAAGLSQGSGQEQPADFGRGAVPIVSETFHHHRDLVGREALIGDEFKLHRIVRESGPLLDGALDGIAKDGRFTRLLDGRGEARVEVGVSPAEFGGDADFTDQLDDHLAFLLRVGFATGLFPLSAHD